MYSRQAEGMAGAVEQKGQSKGAMVAEVAVVEAVLVVASGGGSGGGGDGGGKTMVPFAGAALARGIPGRVQRTPGVPKRTIAEPAVP